MKSEPKTKPTNSRKRSGLKKKTADLRTLAQQTEHELNIIQRSMRQRLQAEFAQGNLTGPQRLVMSVVVRTQGLSLKQLSEAVSLAHSTVSGIVDRLVQQGLVERQPHPTDRRITLLAASPAVRKFLDTRMPQLALHPLLEAMRRATPAERHSITKGLNTLARLLTHKTLAPSNNELLNF
jgi:DNA-binding MarR family transcriptional regulator